MHGRVRKSGSMSARETPDVIRCVYPDLLAGESVRDITEIPVSPIVDRGAVGRGERNRVPNEHVGRVLDDALVFRGYSLCSFSLGSSPRRRAGSGMAPLDLSDQYRKLPHRVRPRSMTNLYNLLVQIDLTILKSTL